MRLSIHRRPTGANVTSGRVSGRRAAGSCRSPPAHTPTQTRNAHPR
ncbi:hypothetical protein FTUN_5074 [Frigoriglobus tundricola]|uniref:Uncharacterized protein n=1 Tax=Frigoriglobus tundricola TaxID=2774151 RepID=A0A6M5YVG9_9BACT|nr:hypothetical protein FTUN_5074 [Frigoriglobus tundricola]